jgi:ketosteroid isomerase-like protein
VGNRAIVDRYAAAIAGDDFDAQDALVHDDYELQFPQSGERIRGRANRRFVFEQYPGREGSGRRPSIGSIGGADEEFIAQPSWPAWTVVHLSGFGDDFTVTGTVTYPDGQLWHLVSLIQMRDGKIWRETTYWGLPFDPPDWRAAVREAP